MRLRARLVLLILATMLPLLGYSAVTQFIRFRTAEQRAASGQAEHKARAVEQAVHARLVALRVLALEPELQSGDFDAFRSAAEALIANELPGSNVLVLDRDARQLMNTAAAPGVALPPRRYLDSLRTVFRTGAPALSDLFLGALSNQPVVAIEVPVKRPDGTVIYDLVLNPTPSAFLDLIVDDQPTAATTTIYDRTGAVVARSRDHREYIGTKAPTALLPHLVDGSETLLRLDAPDGTRKVVALSRIDPFGWRVAVELPGDELSLAAFRSLMPTLLVGGALIALSLVLAVVAAQRIAGPIDALRRLGEAPSERDWSLLRRLPEVREVAVALQAARQRVREHTAALERAIGHRDLLLREVHHRVKNNLQMVDAMISLQGRQTDDHKALEAFSQLRDRVHALAVVHAQLMTSDDLRSFDAATFLRELGEGLSASVGTRERPVAVAVEAEPAGVTLDVASPLGLVLTELVTNSAKHAYRDRAGTVRVRFARSGERQAELVVEDDGDDPEAVRRFAADASGIGARLVQGFVRQLDGEWTAEYDRGLRVTVRFPLPEESQ